jgi:hypothetical protein
MDLPIKNIYENLRTALYKDFEKLPEAEKNRTDTIRLKLIRKAISVPQLILKMTQTDSIIKNITLESAELYYRKTFNHFFNLCCINDIHFEKSEEVFVAFISLKFPDKKVEPLIKEQHRPISRELKNYLRVLSIKSLLNTTEAAIWEIMRALFKLTSIIMQESTDDDFYATLDTMTRKLDTKIKVNRKSTKTKQISHKDRHEEVSSVESEDRY